MKFLTILFLKFLLLPNFLLAETIPTKSNILKQSSYCFKDSRSQVCKELVSKIEKLQLVVLTKIDSNVNLVYWVYKRKLLKLIFLIISQMRKFH